MNRSYYGLVRQLPVTNPSKKAVELGAYTPLLHSQAERKALIHLFPRCSYAPGAYSIHARCNTPPRCPRGLRLAQTGRRPFLLLHQVAMEVIAQVVHAGAQLARKIGDRT
jgi:hypothetical protein